jgi:hypothetical protein
MREWTPTVCKTVVRNAILFDFLLFPVSIDQRMHGLAAGMFPEFPASDRKGDPSSVIPLQVIFGKRSTVLRLQRLFASPFSVAIAPVDASGYGLIPNPGNPFAATGSRDGRCVERRRPMVVTSQCCGHRVTGILVGASNVQRYFPRTLKEIELQLDHLRIECGLGPHFWNGKPEISDPRLCLWLESKVRNGIGHRVPTPLTMIPSGTNSFIVDPAQIDEAKKEMF